MHPAFAGRWKPAHARRRCFAIGPVASWKAHEARAPRPRARRSPKRSREELCARTWIWRGITAFPRRTTSRVQTGRFLCFVLTRICLNYSPGQSDFLAVDANTASPAFAAIKAIQMTAPERLQPPKGKSAGPFDALSLRTLERIRRSTAGGTRHCGFHTGGTDLQACQPENRACWALRFRNIIPARQLDESHHKQKTGLPFAWQARISLTSRAFRLCRSVTCGRR